MCQKSENPEFWHRSGQSGRQDRAQMWSSATDFRFWAEKELTEAVSPSSLHKTATFKPNLPCNDSHLKFFQKQQQNVWFHDEKIKDAPRGFLLLSSHFGLCLCDQIKQWEWWWLLLSFASPLQHNLAMINSSDLKSVFLLSPGQPIPWDSRTRCCSRPGSAPDETQHRRDPAHCCAVILHCCALILAENGGQECCVHQTREGSPRFWGECPPDPAGGG